jgi:hypothetical protein
MIRYFSYALSGESITPDRSFALIILLKKAGIVFPFQPKFNNVKGKLLFHPILQIEEGEKERALALLEGEGIKGAKITASGSYVKW